MRKKRKIVLPLHCLFLNQIPLQRKIEKKADRKDALEALFLALNAATGIQDVQSKIRFIGRMVRTIVEKMAN